MHDISRKENGFVIKLWTLKVPKQLESVLIFRAGYAGS
jgi:hypothetical protein